MFFKHCSIFEVTDRVYQDVLVLRLVIWSEKKPIICLVSFNSLEAFPVTALAIEFLSIHATQKVGDLLE